VAEKEGIREKDLVGSQVVVRDQKNCLLTNGVLPLIQTDQLALESIGKLELSNMNEQADEQSRPTSNQNPSTRMFSYSGDGRS